MVSPQNMPPVLRPDHPLDRSLGELARRFGRHVHGATAGISLSGVTLATSDLHAGDVFVAVAGASRHGAELAREAAARGAVAVVTDAEGADLASSAGIPVILVDDPRAVLGALSAWVYGTDANLPVMFGTTGTNGKTSVTHLLGGMLDQLGTVSGLSSTAERHIAGQVIPSRPRHPSSTRCSR